MKKKGGNDDRWSVVVGASISTCSVPSALRGFLQCKPILTASHLSQLSLASFPIMSVSESLWC